MENEDQAWVDYRGRFADVYDDSNYASPLQATVMRASHRLAERKFDEHEYFSNVLEIGAGTGEHLGYIRHGFDKYVLSDLDPKTLEVAKGKLSAQFGSKLSYEVQNAERLSYVDNSFDRLIATHVLEHVYKPHLVIKEWQRVVKHCGIISILIPTDPGIAWRLGRHLGPRKNAIKVGVAYDYVMAREHVNACNNLISLLRHYFPDSKEEAWWPFSISSIDLNLFFVCHAVVKK